MVVVSLSLRAVHGVVNGQWLLATIAGKPDGVGMVWWSEERCRAGVVRVMLWTMHCLHVTLALS